MVSEAKWVCIQIRKTPTSMQPELQTNMRDGSTKPAPPAASTAVSAVSSPQNAADHPIKGFAEMTFACD